MLGSQAGEAGGHHESWCPFVFGEGASPSARSATADHRLWQACRVMRVDLNADVGESYGAYVVGDDDALFASLTSASVAAGFHAGDPRVLRRTVRLARRHGVSIG